MNANIRRSIATFFIISFLTGSASAQGSDYRSLVSLENEFTEVAKDVIVSLQGMASSQGMTNRRGVEFDCLDVPLRLAFELGQTFTHYKYSVAILDVIKDQEDRQKAIELLKVQTDLVRGELQVHRKRMNEVVGTCSKFPLVVAKGTEVLTVIKKAEPVVKSIADKLIGWPPTR